VLLQPFHSGERAGTRALAILRSRPAMPLVYSVVTLSKLFTHIALPVFSAPRNWVHKEFTDWIDLTV